jgi:hypothetical protein
VILKLKDDTAPALADKNVPDEALSPTFSVEAV